MLDLTLQLIDRLIQLVKTRGDIDQRRFTELVQRIFADMEKVHLDYLKNLEATHRKLRDGADVVQILEQLSKKRLELEPLRRRLFLLIRESMSQPKFARLMRFLEAASEYFQLSDPSQTSFYTSILKLLEAASKNGTSHRRKDAIALVERFLSYVRQQWDHVSEEHAKLLVKPL